MGQRIKQAVLSAGLLTVMVLLLRQNDAVGQAVRHGLTLCGRTVIPALFPFFVTVSCAVSAGFFRLLRQLRLPVPAAVFLLGIIGGYPVGGRTVGELYRAGELSREAAERLLLFCNNAGPSFILSVAGAGVFGSSRMGVLLYIVHIAAALAAGGLMGAFKRGEKPPNNHPFFPNKATDDIPFSALFVKSVQNAAISMVHVCAFVIYFLALMALLQQAVSGLPPLAMGLLELTAGVTGLSGDAVGCVMAAALLGWGGVSVHCQTAAVLADTGLQMGRYLAAKAVQGALSALTAWLLLPLLF